MDRRKFRLTTLIGRPARAWRRWAGRLLVVVVAALVGSYFVADLVRAPLNDTARAELLREGKASTFVPTSQGVMHVRQSGPESGPVVLLVHGSIVGGYGFQNWQKPLADAGYRVIVPDLLEYGYSDRPGVRCDGDFYNTQLHDLLGALHIDKPVHIAGASFGGALVTNYAATYPEDVASVGLMAPAGLGRGAAGVSPFMTWPVVGDWFFRVAAPTIVTNQMSNAYAGSPDRDAMVAWMGEQARHRGYGDGILCAVREHAAFEYLPDQLRTIGASGVPVFAAWGSLDRNHPYARTNLLREWVPQTELLTLQGAGHAITYGRAADVLAGYIPFLDRARRQAAPVDPVGTPTR